MCSPVFILGNVHLFFLWFPSRSCICCRWCLLPPHPHNNFCCEDPSDAAGLHSAGQRGGLTSDKLCKDLMQISNDFYCFCRNPKRVCIIFHSMSDPICPASNEDDHPSLCPSLSYRPIPIPVIQSLNSVRSCSRWDARVHLRDPLCRSGFSVAQAAARTRALGFWTSEAGIHHFRLGL